MQVALCGGFSWIHKDSGVTQIHPFWKHHLLHRVGNPPNLAILGKESDNKLHHVGIHGPTLDDLIYQLFAHFRSWLMWLEVAEDVTLSVH